MTMDRTSKRRGCGEPYQRGERGYKKAVPLLE